jgi:hypothetical protein|tara:strand:- start:4309 stop:5484 length:1176 start_codon:yes stop_codon:yes gene_type:complete
MALRLRRGTDTQRLLITPAEGELVYTTDTQRLYVGDGVTSGGILVNTTSTSSVGELNDVDITSETPATGDVLKWNGTQFAPAPDVGEGLIDYVIVPGSDYQINIVAQDSTRMVDGDNNKLNGDLYGKVYGDSWDDISNEKVIEINGRQAKLDIISDADVLIVNHNNANYYDATGSLLIDGGLRAFVGDVDGDLRGSMYDVNLNKLIDNVAGLATLDLKGSVFGDDSTLAFDGVAGKFNLNDTVTGDVKTRAVDDFTRLVMVRDSAADIASSDLTYGSIQWRRDDANGEETTAFISGGNEALLFMQDSTGAFAADKFMVLDEGSLSIGGFTPTAKLDVRGNVKASGSIQPGVYADNAARDAAIPTPTAGMMVFNTTGTKFQGYTGSAWVDLN